MPGEAIAKDLKPGTLAHLAGEFRVIARRASAAVAHVGPAGVAERPSAARWSVAENLIHLTLASEAALATWRAFDRMQAATETAHGAFKLDLWGRFWVWFLEPPPKARFRSPKRFSPVALPPADHVLATFLASQEQVISAIQHSEGMALNKLKVSSAFNPRLRFSLWTSYCVTLAHQRRHLWQAETAAEQISKRSGNIRKPISR